MEEKLYGAAVVGDVHSLGEILREEPHILHRIAAQNFISTPLHIASLLGHVNFVRVLLGTSPDLAGVLDQRRRSALYLAAEKGHVEVVRALMELEEHGKDMCTAVDDDGNNALHVAAMKGKDDVLKVLMDVVGPDVANQRVKNNQTILHLCVMYRQRETLMQLMDSECQELINAVDEWGETVLHLAVADKQYQIVVLSWEVSVQTLEAYDGGRLDLKERLLSNRLRLYISFFVLFVQFSGKTVKDLANFKCNGNYEKMNLNVKNANGYTALDILLNSRTDEETKDEKNLTTVVLLNLKAKRAKDLIKTEWLTEKRESLMIVTVLIAAMAFQAGVSPPGGVWSDNTTEHKAGETVMAYNYNRFYPYFVRANTVGFVASLSTIFLLLSDLPFRKKSFMWFLVLVMWLTITSMAFTYAFAITVITPKVRRTSLTRTIVVGVIVWCSVMSILLIIHSFRLMKRVVEEEVDKRNEYIAAVRALKNRPMQLLSEIRQSFGKH